MKLFFPPLYYYFFFFLHIFLVGPPDITVFLIHGSFQLVMNSKRGPLVSVLFPGPV